RQAGGSNPLGNAKAPETVTFFGAFLLLAFPLSFIRIPAFSIIVCSASKMGNICATLFGGSFLITALLSKKGLGIFGGDWLVQIRLVC
ncbi:MAG: hypothetical protein Q4C04_08215, partial [Clostridia bacterium]|nr:hypothetical protein [Clostridia bacterium]